MPRCYVSSLAFQVNSFSKAGCGFWSTLTSVVSRKGSRSQNATSWPGTLPQPTGTAGRRLSVGSDAASFVPGTPAGKQACLSTPSLPGMTCAFCVWEKSPVILHQSADSTCLRLSVGVGAALFVHCAPAMKQACPVRGLAARPACAEQGREPSLATMSKPAGTAALHLSAAAVPSAPGPPASM